MGHCSCPGCNCYIPALWRIFVNISLFGKFALEQGTRWLLAILFRTSQRVKGFHYGPTDLNGEVPVINLSASILTQSEIDVLSKGLIYSPSKKFHLYNTILDVNSFVRNLTLRRLQTYEASIRSHSTMQKNNPEFVTFQEQTSICTLWSLQEESIAIVDFPREYRQPGNSSYYPLQSRSDTMEHFQDLKERDLTALYDNCEHTDNKKNLDKKEEWALKKNYLQDRI